MQSEMKMEEEKCEDRDFKYEKCPTRELVPAMKILEEVKES